MRYVADDLNVEESGQQNGTVVRQVAGDQDNTRRGGTIGPHAHGNAARHVLGDLNVEGSGQQNPENDTRNNEHNPQCANYWAL